jgi:hypothetical protein
MTMRKNFQKKNVCCLRVDPKQEERNILVSRARPSSRSKTTGEILGTGEISDK